MTQEIYDASSSREAEGVSRPDEMQVKITRLRQDAITGELINVDCEPQPVSHLVELRSEKPVFLQQAVRIIDKLIPASIKHKRRIITEQETQHKHDQLLKEYFKKEREKNPNFLKSKQKGTTQSD